MPLKLHSASPEALLELPSSTGIVNKAFLRRFSTSFKYMM